MTHQVVDAPTRRVLVWIALVTGTIVVVGGIAGVAGLRTSFRVVSVEATDGVVGEDVIGRCQVPAGASCAFDIPAEGYVAEPVIGVPEGASRSEVAAGLGIAADPVLIDSGTCSSGTLPEAGRFVVYPVGTRYTYRVEQRRWGRYQSTSEPLEAFVPDGVAIVCRIEPLG